MAHNEFVPTCNQDGANCTTGLEGTGRNFKPSTSWVGISESIVGFHTLLLEGDRKQTIMASLTVMAMAVPWAQDAAHDGSKFGTGEVRAFSVLLLARVTPNSTPNST